MGNTCAHRICRTTAPCRYGDPLAPERGDRAMSSVGDPVARDVVARQLAAATDGATVWPSGLPYGGSGIIVAVPEHGRVWNVGPRTTQALADLGATLADLVRSWIDQEAAVAVAGAQTLRPRAFGAWRQGDTLFLDIVEIFPDDEEDAAIAAGRARNQIAIWHAGRGEEIATGGTGE